MQILADRITHEARVSDLLAAVQHMRNSAANFGIPKAEAIDRVFRAARAVEAHLPLEETNA